jgi:hypothetical protein
MKTDYTKGLLTGFDGSTGLYKVADVGGQMFADHGDSGAIVFLLQPNNARVEPGKLLPVGLMVSGGHNQTASFISLFDLFKNFCIKQKIPTVYIEFVNPKLPGKLRYTSRFPTNFLPGIKIN